jgi:hypothetical protein
MRAGLLLIAACWSTAVAADSSVPAPAPAPSGPWQDRCADRMRVALADLVREEPDFSTGTIQIESKPRGVRFEALVADREHARFYSGKPAHYLAHVIEKRAKEPGELGADIGSPNDPQASIGLTRWTREREATLDVQVAEGRKVRRFGRAFKAAIAECLE